MKAIYVSANFDLFVVLPHPRGKMGHAGKLGFSREDLIQIQGGGLTAISRHINHIYTYSLILTRLTIRPVLHIGKIELMPK
jgi:hypothetical protein